MIDTELQFNDVTFDLVKIAISRVLSQYSTSPLYKLLLKAYTDEIQELSNAIKDLIVMRTIAYAERKQLDIIGNIVGFGRKNYNYDSAYWFAPDEKDVSPDNGHWWVKNAPQAIFEPMDDETYRKWIVMKILKNHNKFSAKPEIEGQVQEGIGEKIAIQRTGMTKQDIYTTTSISATNKNLLAYVIDTTLTDNQYLFSYQAATEVGSVTEKQES